MALTNNVVLSVGAPDQTMLIMFSWEDVLCKSQSLFDKCLAYFHQKLVLLDSFSPEKMNQQNVFPETVLCIMLQIFHSFGVEAEISRTGISKPGQIKPTIYMARYR